MPPIFSLLNLAPGRVSFLIHRTATLSNSTRIIGALVSHVCSTRQSCAMTDVVHLRERQRVVIEFLTAEGSSPMETDRHLSSVYGEETMLAQTLVHRFKGSEKDVGDRPHSD